MSKCCGESLSSKQGVWRRSRHFPEYISSRHTALYSGDAAPNSMEDGLRWWQEFAEKKYTWLGRVDRDARTSRITVRRCVHCPEAVRSGDNEAVRPRGTKSSLTLSCPELLYTDNCTTRHINATRCSSEVQKGINEYIQHVQSANI